LKFASTDTPDRVRRDRVCGLSEIHKTGEGVRLMAVL
jgi:hypothetical protein